jgi:CHAT domain-containing protein
MLTVRDLISERLRGTRLVVLLACQTAITDFNDLPEEAIGLPGGFVQAGVPGVVGTLWPVNDLSTMLLMVKFYEAHLKEGLTPAAALRDPNERPYAHPYYWAPFVFYGV